MTRELMLIVDSCCDLPFEVLNKPGIELIQFPYVLGEAQYVDDMYQTITPGEFYGAMRDGAQPTTSQLPIPRLMELFSRAAENGQSAVFLCFSSGLSGSYNSSCLAMDQVKEQYPDADLYVVDTNLASIAEGLLVEEAIRQWERGLTAEQLVDWALEAKYYANHMFMIEDLEVLRRGGRISGTVAFAGAALDVKPMLYIDIDGKLGLTGVARGRKKGMRQLVDLYSKCSTSNGVEQTVLVGHADCEKDAKRLEELVKKEDPAARVILCNIGPVIGSHVGPGMLALCFWGTDRRDDLSIADRIAKKVRSK